MEHDINSTPPSSEPELYKEQTAEEEVDKKVMPWIKRFTLAMLKIVTSIIAGLMLAVSVPAISETVDEVTSNPVQIITVDKAGKQVTEEAGVGTKTANAIGTFVSNAWNGGKKIKDNMLDVSTREKNLRVQVKQLEREAIRLRQELITYKVSVGLDHGTAKSCSLLIHDYLQEMEGN